MSNANNARWISFEWSMKAGVDPSCKKLRWESYLMDLEHNTDVTWYCGEKPSAHPYRDYNDTHLLFDTLCRRLTNTADPGILLHAHPVYTMFDFVMEINARMGHSMHQSPVPDEGQERFTVEPTTTYDTTCYHCGAPAQTLMFSVKCSKGCGC